MGSLPRSRFWNVTQRSPKRTFWGALCDIQKTAAMETSRLIDNGRRGGGVISLGRGSYKRKLTIFGDVYHEVSGSFHLQI